MSPTVMLGALRPSELGLWAALWAVDPWDEQRADLRAGVVASVLANVNRDSKRRGTPFRPVDFMPYRQMDDDERQRDLSRRLRSALSAAGKVKR